VPQWCAEAVEAGHVARAARQQRIDLVEDAAAAAAATAAAPVGLPLPGRQRSRSRSR